MLVGLRVGRMMQISCKVLPQPRFCFHGFRGFGICLAGVILVVTAVFLFQGLNDSAILLHCKSTDCFINWFRAAMQNRHEARVGG